MFHQQICEHRGRTEFGCYVECPYCSAILHFFLGEGQQLDPEETCRECGKTFLTDEGEDE